MNIVHVVDQVSLTHGGGVASCVYNLAEAEARLSHNVSIYTTDWQLKGQRPPENVNLRAFHLTGSPLGVRVSLGMLMADLPRGCVVHIHNYRGWPELIFSLTDRPVVFEAHGSLPFSSSDIIGATAEFFFRNCIFKRALALIAKSPVEVKQYQEYGGEPEKIRTITPGINPAEYESLPERNEKPYKTILYLGRINQIKGIELLVHAFQVLDRSDVHLIIAGNTDDEKYLNEIKQLAGMDFPPSYNTSSRIHFVGPLYGKDKIQAYVDADLYVLPSKYEIFGITVLEALACGCPALVMDGHGIQAEVKSRNLWTSAPEPQKLAEVIDAILRTSKIQNGCELITRSFSWDRIASQHTAVYQEVLS